MGLDLQLTLYLVKGVAFLTAVALVLRAPARPLPVGLVATAAVMLLAGLLYGLARSPLFGVDYQFFWKAGRDVWAGLEPYADGRFNDHPFLNPPTALPLFALFAVLPLPLSLTIWTVGNLLAGLALVAWSQNTLRTQDGMDDRGGPYGLVPWALSPAVIVGLTVALVVSDASLLTFYLGQLSILAAVLLLAALAAQGRGRPVWAGVCLALATVKVPTMLPFLLLFLRKADRWAWAALGAGVLALCLLSGPPSRLPGRLATLVERIQQLEAPGAVNDYSFEGPRHENMLGFGRALYCVGLRDRRVIRVAEYLVLAVLGAWVSRQILSREGLPRAAACSLVALYSVVFLYHRNYDAVILALPLAYCAGQARAAGGAARWLFTACAVAILLVLYLDLALLREVFQWSQARGVWGRVVQAVVLPYATWSILIAMVCLVLGARKVQAAAANGVRPAALAAVQPDRERPARKGGELGTPKGPTFSADTSP
jgi:hypothetical protein